MPANDCQVDAYIELADDTDVELFLDEVDFYEASCFCSKCHLGIEHVPSDAEIEAALP